MFNGPIQYEKNKRNEHEKLVAQDFQYDSSNNPDFLTIDKFVK